MRLLLISPGIHLLGRSPIKNILKDTNIFAYAMVEMECR